LEDVGDNDEGLLPEADEEQPGLLSEQMGSRTPGKREIHASVIERNPYISFNYACMKVFRQRGVVDGMKKQQFEISIDHSMMIGAKAAFDTCLRAAIAKAISTGSDEGSATLKVSFEIFSSMDSKTGEYSRTPVMKYKAGYTVPMKESMDATIAESSRLMPGDESGWLLVNGQVSMAELMDGNAEE